MKQVRAVLRPARRWIYWRIGLLRLRRRAPTRLPDHRLLRMLRIGWGNTATASEGYLAAVAAAAQCAHAGVLECGSGLTTVLLSAYAGRQGIPVVALEHHSGWQQRVTRAVTRVGGHGDVRLAPLTSYGLFEWYRVDDLEAGRFDLVICDGPPGKTLGGRYGLLPIMGEALAPGAVILLDDAERDGELAALDRWVSEFGVVLIGIETEGRRAFARMKSPPEAPRDPTNY